MSHQSAFGWYEDGTFTYWCGYARSPAGSQHPAKLTPKCPENADPRVVVETWLKDPESGVMLRFTGEMFPNAKGVTQGVVLMFSDSTIENRAALAA